MVEEARKCRSELPGVTREAQLASVLGCTALQQYRFRRRMPSGEHPVPSNAKHIGLDRFGVRVRPLQPSLNFPSAARVALVTWSEAADLEPEVAEEIYLRE